MRSVLVLVVVTHAAVPFCAFLRIVVGSAVYRARPTVPHHPTAFVDSPLPYLHTVDLFCGWLLHCVWLCVVTFTHAICCNILAGFVVATLHTFPAFPTFALPAFFAFILLPFVLCGCCSYPTYPHVCSYYGPLFIYLQQLLV